MASTEDDIKSLIRSRFYASKEEVISDAVKALLKQKPELEKEIALGSTKGYGDYRNVSQRG